MRIILISVSILLTACSSLSDNTEKLSLNQKSVKGVWGWDTEQCNNNPATISFKTDGSIMYFDTYKGMYLGDVSKPIKRIEYVIESEKENVLITSIKGEDRLDDNSKPVGWDLVIQSTDNFCWHRTDWAEGACTKSLMRCK